MAFLSDPYQRQQLALMLAGGTSGMGGVPRLAGWSAPIGRLGQGLAATMPYMMQMQQDQQAQQQQQQAMQQLQQSMQGLPNMEGNPYAPIVQSLLKSPYGAEEALKMLPAMAAWQPPSAASAKSPEGQLIEDWKAGRMSHEEFTAAWNKQTHITPAASMSVVNKITGPIPEDMKAVYDKAGNLLNYEVIPGSKTWKAQQSQVASQQQAADIVTQKVTEAKGIINNAQTPVSGFWGNIASNVPGTEATDLTTVIDTIKANAGLDRLTELRKSSPTGGGLGNVTEPEMNLLTSTIASLSQKQSKEQLLKHLDEVNAVYAKIINGDPEKKLNAGPQPMRIVPSAGQSAAPDPLGIR